MTNIAIRVENLSKRYRIGLKEEMHDTLFGAMADFVRQPIKNLRRLRRLSRFEEDGRDAEDIIWALKDVSFEVEQGEVVGIIGRNGAGKTTLLKILSRITEPTSGRAEIRDRVSSLLEVGTGFHSELTGRENVYLNGTILGMRKAEVDRKFDEIVDFSGVEKFIDTPVKRYSSGMRVRLAFSVAAHLEPEILLVDEVLAVGDAAFQKKCLGKMGDVAEEGRTILFVSHNMAAIENLCQRSILLESGSIACTGNTPSVIKLYLETVLPPAIKQVPLAHRVDRSGNGKVRLTSFHIENETGQHVPVLLSGHEAVFVVGYICKDKQPVRNVSMSVGLYTNRNQGLFILNSTYTDQKFDEIPPVGEFRCHIPRFPLTPGRYIVGARVTVCDEEADWPKDGIGYVDVGEADFFGSAGKGLGGGVPFLVDGSWSVEGKGDMQNA